MMTNGKRKLGELLLEYQMISPANLESALKEQKKAHKRIGEVLIELQLVNQDQINWILSKQFDIPYVRIELEQLDLKLLKDFPEYLVKNYRLIPLMEMNGIPVIAMTDPTDDEAIQKVKFFYQKDINIVFTSFENISEMIENIEKQHPEIWE